MLFVLCWSFPHVPSTLFLSPPLAGQAPVWRRLLQTPELQSPKEARAQLLPPRPAPPPGFLRAPGSPKAWGGAPKGTGCGKAGAGVGQTSLWDFSGFEGSSRVSHVEGAPLSHGRGLCSVQALMKTSCVTLGRSQNLSGPQLPHLCNSLLRGSSFL